MEKLTGKIEELKEKPVKEKVDQRMKEFEQKGKQSSEEIFKEACFCILTANFNAKKAIEIQEKIDDGFIDLPEKDLADKLKELGYRYPNKRAEYIVEGREHSSSIKSTLEPLEEKKARKWVKKNIKGLGWKESSHFLRNIGYKDLAIIDFHILDLLDCYNVIEKPDYLRKKNYMNIEKKLAEIAERTDLYMGELDLYLWYMETGKIFK